MSFFKTLEHAIASTAMKVVAEFKTVTNVLTKVEQIGAQELPVIEGVSSLINKNAPRIEDAAFASLGYILKAVGDTSAAISSSGLNIQLDEAALADYKDLWNFFKGHPAVQASQPPAASVVPAH